MGVSVAMWNPVVPSVPAGLAWLRRSLCCQLRCDEAADLLPLVARSLTLAGYESSWSCCLQRAAWFGSVDQIRVDMSLEDFAFVAFDCWVSPNADHGVHWILRESLVVLLGCSSPFVLCTKEFESAIWWLIDVWRVARCVLAKDVHLQIWSCLRLSVTRIRDMVNGLVPNLCVFSDLCSFRDFACRTYGAVDLDEAWRVRVAYEVCSCRLLIVPAVKKRLRAKRRRDVTLGGVPGLSLSSSLPGVVSVDGYPYLPVELDAFIANCGDLSDDSHESDVCIEPPLSRWY